MTFTWKEGAISKSVQRKIGFSHWVWLSTEPVRLSFPMAA